MIQFLIRLVQVVVFSILQAILQIDIDLDDALTFEPRRLATSSPISTPETVIEIESDSE